MKSYIVVALFIVVGAFSVSDLAADPVDLRDKEGVVDPKDLKNDDPKDTPVNTKEPLQPENDNDHFDFEPTSEGHSGSASKGDYESTRKKDRSEIDMKDPCTVNPKLPSC